jgi:hypothetical protein
MSSGPTVMVARILAWEAPGSQTVGQKDLTFQAPGPHLFADLLIASILEQVV